MIALLALAWGGAAALPFVLLVRREPVVARLASLRAAAARGPRRSRRRRVRGWSRHPSMTTLGRVLGAPARLRRGRRRDASIRRELPVVVDLVGVALAAGCTPFLAVELAARYGPSRSAATLREVLRACALGHSLDEALRNMGASVTTLRPLAEALRTSARLGTPAAPALAHLAADVRADVRRRAEARARTVPVRLCFPLVVCVLPAFALLTVVPVVVDGLHA